ncbi:Spy/CpxP family protein refolding chaperone [Burkholderia guangdongensis]|uniref:Spy/CpxP family protein refolding chaperone n=1 Tax=Burkholderia guangdongensis TaxID=1792500 RepID=UPI0015CD25A3|nr:Spy/CpxP family protein refolding chaperone [Burkholderia guangdongensis]
MKKISLTLTLAALALSASAFAQTSTSAQPASAAAPAAASAQQATQHAARREARIEERIAYLHSHLKITQAQEPQWKTFADTMRENGETMGHLYRERMASKSGTAVDDMKQYAEIAQANADGAKKLADAFEPLYTSFPADQKALADSTFNNWRHTEHHHGPAKHKAAPGAAASGAAAN